MSAAPAPSPDSNDELLEAATRGAHRTGPARMDRAFVIDNQIIERYLSGRLPRKGAQDFEQFCREHPDVLEEIGLSAQINAGLRLLEAGGQASPWEEKPRRWWEKPQALFGALGACALLGMLALIVAGKLSATQRTVSSLQNQLAAQPLDPAELTRRITLIPNRTAPSQQSQASIGGGTAEFDDLHIDVSWSKFTVFQITIDRIGQGRVGVLHGMARDSNGELRLGLNSSALGPGDYQLTIDGLNWRGEAQVQAWASFTIVR